MFSLVCRSEVDVAQLPRIENGLVWVASVALAWLRGATTVGHQARGGGFRRTTVMCFNGA